MNNIILKVFNFLFNKNLKEAKISKQDLKNQKFVSRIYLGHRPSIDIKQVFLIDNLFAKWQIVQKNMFLNASKEKHKLRSKFIKKK